MCNLAYDVMSSIAFLRRSLGTVGRNERFGMPPRVVVLLGGWATSVCRSAPRELVDRRVADSTTGSSCMSSVTNVDTDCSIYGLYSTPKRREREIPR